MSYIISLGSLTDVNHLTTRYHCVLSEGVIVWYQIKAAMQGTLDVMGRILPTTPCSPATQKPMTDVRTTQMRPQRLITLSSPGRHGNDNWITLIRCLRFWSRRLKCIVDVLILKPKAVTFKVFRMESLSVDTWWKLSDNGMKPQSVS